jgi:hypothetical protein
MTPHDEELAKDPGLLSALTIGVGVGDCNGQSGW